MVQKEKYWAYGHFVLILVLIGVFQLGQILKTYFKKENLVSEVFSSYMRENYFTRAGLDQSSFSLNVQACRLVLDILPGLEVRIRESSY